MILSKSRSTDLISFSGVNRARKTGERMISA